MKFLKFLAKANTFFAVLGALSVAYEVFISELKKRSIIETDINQTNNEKVS